MNRVYAMLPVLLVCVWVGCGRSTTVTGPDSEEVTVSRDGGSVEVTVEGEGGETLRFSGNEDGVELPDNLPADVPIYPGATPFWASTMGEGFQITLRTSDSTQDVKASYEASLEENGWEIEMTSSMPGGTMLGGSKDQRSLTVTISRDEAEGGTIISLIGNY